MRRRSPQADIVMAARNSHRRVQQGVGSRGESRDSSLLKEEIEALDALKLHKLTKAVSI
jgi:hypothetical protein